MPLNLQSKLAADDGASAARLPIDFSSIEPERLRGQSLAEIERRRIFCGHRELPLAELFTVSGDPADGEINLSGDLASVHGIGTRMAAGTIRINGNAGRHVGAEMRGGTIELFGDAGDWLGAEMRGGRILVHGNAADYAAAAYPGGLRGMTGGELLIDGNAGNHLGTAMRRGLIAVGGSAGLSAGGRMIAGTIVIGGVCGRGIGAGMRRGTIVLMNGSGQSPNDQRGAELLPTFGRANRWNPPFLRLLLVHLQRLGFLENATPEGQANPHSKWLNAWIDSQYVVYSGDSIALGKAEILVRA